MKLAILAFAFTYIWSPPYAPKIMPATGEPIDACGLVRNNGDVLAIGGAEPGVEVSYPFTVPERPDAPDVIMRAQCWNIAGPSKLSAEVACGDVVQEDCQRICGDVSNDLRISLVDFYLIRQAVAKNENPDFCDVNGDRECALADFYLVRQAVAGQRTDALQQKCKGVVP